MHSLVKAIKNIRLSQRSPPLFRNGICNLIIIQRLV